MLYYQITKQSKIYQIIFLYKSLTLFTALLARRNKQIFSYCFNQNETLWCNQVGLTFKLSVVEELQQAANFDNWKFFILLAGIFALLASGVFTFGSWKEFQMYRGGRNSVVAETIYILGLRMELERPVCLGSESSAAVEVSGTSSMVSIFGFGYDDDYKWTFAGRRPLHERRS